jgi:hypothetical protein
MQPYLIYLRNLILSNRELLFNEIEIDTSGYFEILKNEYKISGTSSESRRRFSYSAINNSTLIRVIKKRKRERITT